VNLDTVCSRTAICWQLAFVHAGKTLHHLTSALLMSLASAGLGMAWLCCWIERFCSSKHATSWIISPHSAPLDSTAREVTIGADKLQPFAMGKPQPRTIDSLIRNKGAGFSSKFN
jgi:hypothetical protein